jgi:hypothetical protein
MTVPSKDMREQFPVISCGLLCWQAGSCYVASWDIADCHFCLLDSYPGHV